MEESARDIAAEEQRLRCFIDDAIRPFLDRYYPAPQWIASVADGVVVCRCEEVTAGQLREAMTHGCSGPNQAKSFLRCGMGPCQGRMCQPACARRLHDLGINTLEQVGPPAFRQPLVPVTLGQLCGHSEHQPAPAPAGLAENESADAAKDESSR
jgi:hypothetical protein